MSHPIAQGPRQALQALSGAVGALALAEALGAPPGALGTALTQLGAVLLVLRQRGPFWRPLPVRRQRRRPHPPKARSRVGPELEDVTSPWDPETPYERIEVSRCKALLLEVIGRAINDWVLYRGHRKRRLRELADSAYLWLFEEDPGTHRYRWRENEGTVFTSFFSVCEMLDLDPGYVRRKAKETTVRQIMTKGRPAERRKAHREMSYDEHRVSDESVKVDALDCGRGEFTSDVEAHFASYTPDYL